MNLYKLVKREPEKKSGLEIFVDIALAVLSISALLFIVYTLYKKWKRSTLVQASDDDFNDEWFCDCDDCSDEDSASVDDGSADAVKTVKVDTEESEAEIEYEDKEDIEL
jgi:competence protein ComGF